MTTQDASDMANSSKATMRVTQSPWVHKDNKPVSAFINSYSKTKTIGTENHMASATPPRLPGT